MYFKCTGPNNIKVETFTWCSSSDPENTLAYENFTIVQDLNICFKSFLSYLSTLSR